MGDAGHLFDIEHRDGRVGDGLGKDRLGVGLDLSLEGLLVRICVHKRSLNAKALEGDGEQVDGAAVDGGGAQDVVPGAQDVEHRNQGSGLSGGGAQRTHTAFQRGDLFLHGGYRWVGDAGVHVAVSGQVKQLGYLGGRFIFIGRALVNRQRQRLSVLRGVALVQALGFNFHGHQSFSC